VLSAVSDAIDEGRSKAKQEDSLSPLTAQGIAGGALSVIHARLLARPLQAREGLGAGTYDNHPLAELVNPLMAMIVQPYLGAAAARSELKRPAQNPVEAVSAIKDPFDGLSIRFTYRTARVLAAIAANSGASNRLIADRSGVADEGQMSRLLMRLQRSCLIENSGEGQVKGEPNAWTLTGRGEAVHAALGVKA
jgi:hypothetical protein